MTTLQSFIAGSVVLLASWNAANAQTVDDIINKYTDAIGGKAVLASMRTAQIEGTQSIDGNDVPFKRVIVDGKTSRSEAELFGVVVVQCVTDTGGWALNPASDQKSPQVLPTDQVKKEANSFIYIAGPLVDYQSKGLSAELLGKEDVNGVAAYKVRLFDNAGTDITYDIDPTSYLILKSARKEKLLGTDAVIITTFSNYQKTPIGYTMAYSSASSEVEVTTTVSKVTFNQDVDPQICALPK